MCLLSAIIGADEIPAVSCGLRDNEMRCAPCRSRCGEQLTRAEEERHFFFAARNAFMSASSRVIHARIWALGMSRTINVTAFIEKASRAQFLDEPAVDGGLESEVKIAG